MKRFKVFLILVSIFAAGIASAEMDWENLIIKSSTTDQGTASDLLKNELYSIQYDDTKTVGDYLRAHFDRENRLTGLLFEYQTMKQNYLTDGGIEYVYQLPLKNKIMSLLLPDKKGAKLVVPMLCPCCGQEWPSDKPVPEGVELIPKEIESIDYTGIIIDCRNFPINPCLFPEIYNEKFDEIYSINFANLGAVTEKGLVLYTTEDLYNSPRVGYNPLRIQAVGVFGDRMTNLKIPSFDARRIHGSKKNIKLLNECRVAIIYSP